MQELVLGTLRMRLDFHGRWLHIRSPRYPHVGGLHPDLKEIL